MIVAAINSALRRCHVMMPVLVAGFVGVALWWLLPPPPRAVLPGIEGGPSRCLRLTFAPDGRCVATWHFPPANQNGPRLLRLWDVADGRLLATLHRGERQLESLAFAPDGQHVAGRWFDRGIEVWDRAGGRSIAEYRRPAWEQWNPHLQIVYTPDNRLLAYGPDPGSGKLWDVVTGREVCRLFRGDEEFGMVAGGYPGYIITLREGRLQAWHLAAAELRAAFAVGELSGGGFGLSDDGRTLAGYTAGPERRIRVWEAETGHGYEVPAGDGSASPALAPDGQAVAVVFDDAVALHPMLDWLAELFGSRVDLTARRSQVRVIGLPGGHVAATLDHVESATFAPDGRTLAVRAVDGAVYLYDWPLARPWLPILAGAGLAASVTAACHWLIAARRWGRSRMGTDSAANGHGAAQR